MRDRRRMRHQRHFAQSPRALVGVDQLPQHLFAARRMRLHNASLLKPHLDAFDHGPLVRKRLGCGHGALGALLMRHAENLFRRHVGNAVESVPRRRTAAHPHVVIRQPQQEIGSWPAVAQRRVALFVQPRRTHLQIGIVRLPRAHRILLVDARGLENCLPQLVHRCVGRIPGKHRRGPRRRGAGNDGPVDLLPRNQLQRRPIGL